MTHRLAELADELERVLDIKPEYDHEGEFANDGQFEAEAVAFVIRNYETILTALRGAAQGAEPVAFISQQSLEHLANCREFGKHGYAQVIPSLYEVEYAKTIPLYAAPTPQGGKPAESDVVFEGNKVCPECGGRASACAVLGHRPLNDRPDWQSSPMSPSNSSAGPWCSGKTPPAPGAQAGLTRLDALKNVAMHARRLVDHLSYVVGLPADDEYKGPGNDLADALEALDALPVESGEAK